MQTRCREQIEQTCRERDQAVLDVQSLERAFSDLHRRFDKSKQIIASAEKVQYSLVYEYNLLESKFVYIRVEMRTYLQVRCI